MTFKKKQKDWYNKCYKNNALCFRSNPWWYMQIELDHNISWKMYRKASGQKSRGTFQGQTYPAMLMLDSSMFQQYNLFSRLMSRTMKLKYTEMLQDSRCAHVPFTIFSSSDPHIILPESNLCALVDSSELKAVAMWEALPWLLDEDLLHFWSDIPTGSVTFQGAVKSR